MARQQQIDVGELLRGIAPYSSLDPDEFSRLVDSARIQYLDKGSTLFKQGDACRGVYVIISGQIKLAFCSLQGVEKVVGILGTGEGVGEACMSIGQHYPMNAEALSDTKLLFLPQGILREFLESNRHFAHQFTLRIAEILHFLLLDMESTSLLSGAERIVSFLIRQLNDTSEGPQAVIRLAQTKSVIASRLSLTQEHFSRLLRQLSEQGMICVKGRLIHIPDINRLQEYLKSGSGHCVNRGGRSAGRGRERIGRDNFSPAWLNTEKAPL